MDPPTSYGWPWPSLVCWRVQLFLPLTRWPLHYPHTFRGHCRERLAPSLFQCVMSLPHESLCGCQRFAWTSQFWSTCFKIGVQIHENVFLDIRVVSGGAIGYRILIRRCRKRCKRDHTRLNIGHGQLRNQFGLWPFGLLRDIGGV